MRLLTLAFVSALILIGCASSRSLSDLPESEMSGLYSETPGGQWFRACGENIDDPAFWVTFTDRAVSQKADFDSLSGAESVYVRWVAATGDVASGDPEGPGPGSRYMLVRDILEVGGSCN